MHKTLCGFAVLFCFSVACVAVPVKAVSLRGLLTADERERAIAWYAVSLPLEDRAMQLIIAGIDGSENLTSSTRAYPAAPGAFLFFAYNIASDALKVITFTAQIHQLFRERGTVAPLLIIDHEGGQVNRLRKIASPLPSALEVAVKLTPAQAEELYYYAGMQLSALGFTLNLAPVAEAENSENAQFLDTRSFGSAAQVQLFTSAALRGYKKAGVAVTVKHFPGNTAEDPHYGLPRLAVSSEVFERQYLYPFRQVLLARPQAVLISHVIISAADDQNPACFSPKLVRNTLRRRFNYEGLILSDDLYMGALSYNGFPPEIAVTAAVDAGVNMLMLSAKNVLSAHKALVNRAKSDPAFLLNINDSVRRILRFKLESGLLSYRNGRIVLPDLPSVEERGKTFFAAKEKGHSFYTDLFENP